MGITLTKVIFSGVIFLVIFLSGVWMRISGKPYRTLILTIHKLISVGVLAYLGAAVYQLYQEVGVSTVELTVSVISGVLFILAIITGGLVSTEKEMPVAVSRLHKTAPYLAMLSTAAALILLMR